MGFNMTLRRPTVGLCLVFGILMFFISCGRVDVAETFDPSEQLAKDIVIIEDYLETMGYTEYDTLPSEIRMVIFDQGTGDPINYGEIIRYNYIGYFTSNIMFDTSIGSLALAQDLEYALDTVYRISTNGKRVISRVLYEEGYTPIYNPSRTYTPFQDTHTEGGWFMRNYTNNIVGFIDGLSAVLDEVNIGGRGLVLIPSGLGYRNVANRSIPANTVLIFEFHVLKKI
jgi:hypothetical protein